MLNQSSTVKFSAQLTPVMTRAPWPVVARKVAMFAALALILCAPAAYAAPVPWRNEDVSFAVREQPLRNFLEEFFSSQGLSVVVSPVVQGTVNGNFNGQPGRIFDDITKAFSLLPYYDGTLVYVYSVSEASTRTVVVPKSLVPRMMRTMDDLRMLNGRHTARSVPAEGLIVLSGSRRFLEQAEELSRNLQVQISAGPTVFKMFPLRYAWAQDVSLAYAGRTVLVPGVASVLRSLLATPSNAGLYFDQADRPIRPTVEKLRGKGLRSIGEDHRVIERESVNVEDSYQQQPAMVNGGDGVRIEAERRLNAVIVRDTKERMPYYDQLIAALDVEPNIIEIEATIVDIDTDRLRELGVNWRYSNANGDEVLFGRGDTSDLSLRPGQNTVPAGQGFFASTTIGDRSFFLSRVNALATDGVAKIVSRPQVVTLSNVEAVVEANTSFFVRIQGEFDVDLFNVQAGTTLRVTPHVMREPGRASRIRLLVNVEDGNLTDASVDQIPVIDRSAINTQTMINEGESLLIGGLVRDRTTKTVTKVPLLGDIPLLKYLFRYSRKRTEHIERLFLITPRLVPAQRIAGGQSTDSVLKELQSPPPAPPPKPAGKKKG
jgi:type III secretion protein C